MKTVFIAAGHGGIDPQDGKYTTKRDANSKWFAHASGKFHNGFEFYEGVSNRNFAKTLTELLIQSDFHVVPVHHAWVDNTIVHRTSIANSLASQSILKESIYLDLHSNSGGGKARGFVAFHHPNSLQGKKLADAIAEYVNPLWLQEGANYGNDPVRDGYFVQNGQQHIYGTLIQSKMPAVILENGFFDNLQDATLLMEHKFVLKICVNIVHGVKSYFSK
jgi:N-acetylmuramoyl-L-alanine amidase